MCDPMTLAATQAAISVGSAAIDYQGARAQYKMQNQMHALNKANAYDAMRHSYMTAQQRQQQEMVAASNEIEARRLEAMRQTATGNVASGEAGISGFSVERVLRDVNAIASRDISTIQQNRDWAVGQLHNEMLGTRNQTVSRIQSVPKGIRPNAWSYVFRAGAGAANAFQTAQLGK